MPLVSSTSLRLSTGPNRPLLSPPAPAGLCADTLVSLFFLREGSLWSENVKSMRDTLTADTLSEALF